MKNWITKQYKDIGGLIKELLFFIAAIIVFIPLGILGLIYSLFKHFIKLDFSLNKYVTPILRGITLSIDGFGNSGGGELMNDVMKPKVKFGKWYQTISAIAGINYVYYNSLEKFRNILNKCLGKLHCEEAISESDRFYYNEKLK